MATPSLKGIHVLMVVAPQNFRDEELLHPKAVFEREGAVVDVASTTADVARGMLGAEVKPDLVLSAVDPHRYAAIVLVGGAVHRRISGATTPCTRSSASRATRGPRSAPSACRPPRSLVPACYTAYARRSTASRGRSASSSEAARCAWTSTW
jgi:protease I